jgi:hypothetical protein
VGRVFFLKTLAAILFACSLFSACQSEATKETEAVQPTSSATATERGGCPTGYCEFTIFAVNDVTVEFCGDLSSTTSGCNFGCNTLMDDRYEMSVIASNNFVTFCIASTGSICIRNPATAASNAVLILSFQGTSTPLNVTIPPGVVRCFYTDVTCSEINGGCN